MANDDKLTYLQPQSVEGTPVTPIDWKLRDYQRDAVPLPPISEDQQRRFFDWLASVDLIIPPEAAGPESSLGAWMRAAIGALKTAGLAVEKAPPRDLSGFEVLHPGEAVLQRQPDEVSQVALLATSAERPADVVAEVLKQAEALSDAYVGWPLHPKTMERLKAGQVTPNQATQQALAHRVEALETLLRQGAQLLADTEPSELGAQWLAEVRAVLGEGK